MAGATPPQVIDARVRVRFPCQDLENMKLTVDAVVIEPALAARPQVDAAAREDHCGERVHVAVRPGVFRNLEVHAVNACH